MKYSTINYDSNRPILNMVKAPLNSDIGVAIKVWKDGQLLDTDLSVDGLSATSTRNGWQLFELSTGSSLGRVEYDVKAVKEKSMYLDMNDVCLSGNSTARDKQSNMSPWNLYDTSIAGKKLYPNDIQKYITSAIVSTATEVSSFVLPLENTGIKVLNNPMFPVDGMWCSYFAGEYIPVQEYIDISASTPVRAQMRLPAHSDVSIILQLNVDSGDGFDDSFKLAVVQEDNNTIEVK